VAVVRASEHHDGRATGPPADGRDSVDAGEQGWDVDSSGGWDEVKDRALGIVRAVDRWLPDRLSRLARRFADREILLSASSLAFYGLVSALPLLLIAFSFVEAVAGDDTLRNFADQVAEQGPEGSGEFLDQLVDNGGNFGIVTLLFTLWPATAYGGGLRRALSRHSEGSESAAGLRGRLLGLSMVLVLPVVVLAGIPTMFLLSSLLGDGALETALGWGLALVAGTILATVLTTALYHAFSPEALGFRQSLKGAAVTAVVTAFYSLGFVIYLELGDTEERFGGGVIAVVVLLGLWLFVANILLIGGYEAVLELEDELEDR
jgi:membrane protein